jgi:hypothetical protein
MTLSVQRLHGSARWAIEAACLQPPGADYERMASEYRCILFPWRDIREGLVAFQRRRGVAIPVRDPDTFVVDPKKLGIELTYAETSRPQIFRFDRETIAAALILQCKERGVRLPRKSNKHLYLIDTRLALLVHIAGPETEEFLVLELARHMT